MRAIFTVFSAIADVLAPNTTLTRLTWRTRLDRVLTLAIAAFALAVTMAYQLYARWAPRADARD